MRLRTYVLIWLFLTLTLSYESLTLNAIPELSILRFLQECSLIPATASLNPIPGGTVSLWLGWIGFSLMVAAAFYVPRKRVPFLRSLGNISGWLDFHIFCGLLGPSFILFHTNFRAGGIAGVAFWAMGVTFLSGLVGRYLYLQVAQGKAELDERIEILDRTLSERVIRLAEALPPERFVILKERVLELAGVSMRSGAPHLGWVSPLLSSVTGDVRLRVGVGLLGSEVPRPVRVDLKRYAIATRRSQYIEVIRQIMGYWNAFHAPFSCLMYGTAVFHIVSSMIFMQTR